MDLRGRNDKFDIQLYEAQCRESSLAEVIRTAKFEKIELKAETWKWRRTGNLFVEYEYNGRPSGIAATEADYWCHQVFEDDGKTEIGWFMIPVPYLKKLARRLYRQPYRRKEVCGDGGRSKGVCIPVRELLNLAGGTREID